MPIANARVKRFSPTGASDSLDATDEFPGACSALTNLVPDLSTRNVWACRPAIALVAPLVQCPNLVSGHTPGTIVVFKVVGDYVYGLFSDVTAGTDGPFAYNLKTSSWITVTGTGAHPPILSYFSEIPPTMDVVGKFAIVTHPNFSSPNFFGWFDLTNPAAPVWNTGDLTSGGAITFASLGSIPAWVVQFNQRAYFGVNNLTQPSVVATDVLTLKITNASQALTFGDTVILNCAAPLSLSNQLGGIIQALMVFKGTSNIYQITGDFATTNIAINTLNVATGTLSPRSVCRTPLGLTFLSPDGLRLIDQQATVSDPIGAGGKGLVVPFVYELGNIQFPQTVAAGCDGVTIRISLVVQNDVFPGSPYVEYWFNMVRKVWSGPHSCAAAQYDIYNSNFLQVPSQGLQATLGLYNSGTDPDSSSIFIENGVQMTFAMQSAVLEDNAQMAASNLSEMQVVASATANNTMNVALLDPNGGTINTASITVNGTGLWPYRVDFPAQSVFNRAAISISGNSAAGVRLGDTWMRLQTLGYIPPPPNPPTS